MKHTTQSATTLLPTTPIFYLESKAFLFLDSNLPKYILNWKVAEASGLGKLLLMIIFIYIQNFSSESVLTTEI